MILSMIKREVTLHYSGDKVTVIIARPKGKYWVTHTYSSTPASLERIKRLIGYPQHCGLLICHTGPVMHWKEYSAYI